MARGSVPTTPPWTRELDYRSIVMQMWGDQWHAPEISYDFSNGRKFIVTPGTEGPYVPPDTGSAGT